MSVSRTRPEDSRAPRPGWSRLGGWLLIAVVGGVVPVAIASAYGALDIPRSDDWSYLVTLFRWVDGGGLAFNHWAAMPLIGQLVVAVPAVEVFGNSITAVHVLSALVGVVGLVAVAIAGDTVIPRRAAMLVALTIAASPMWMALAPTYMTDHWAFAAEMVALACGLEFFRRDRASIGWLAASVAFGFLGVTIRQYAVVVVVAVLIAAAVDAWTKGDRRGLRSVMVITVVFLAATGVVLAWWSDRPGVENLAPVRPGLSQVNVAIRATLGYLRLLGLLLAPVVVLAGPLRIARSAWRSSRLATVGIAGGLGAALALEFVSNPRIPFVGNYVARPGVLGNDVLRGPRPNVVPSLIFDALVWIGIAAVILIALRAVPALMRVPRRLRDHAWPDPVTLVLALNVIGFVILVPVGVLAEFRAFDRYLLPLVPVVAFAVLRDREGVGARIGRSRRIGSGVAVALLAIVGVAFAADSASFDATRWEVAEAVTRAGYKPLQVDGGFEWVAWHRRDAPPYGPKLDPAERIRQLRIFEAPFCARVVIAGDRLPERAIAQSTSKVPSRRSMTIVAYPLPKRC